MATETKPMSAEPDRLSLLRNKYFEALRAKKAEIEKLQQKITLLDELEVESAELKENFTLPSQGRYSDMSLTDAAYDAVKEIVGPVTIAQIKKHLLEGGFVPAGNNFAISLAKTLKRLNDKHKLETDLNHGKRRYWKPEVHLTVAK
jgi:hypothetical protein